MGERGKNQRQRRSFERVGSSFSLEPALLTWQTTPGIACFADPDRAELRRGNDYTPVTIDDMSSSLDCSGCHILVLVSAPEG